MSKPNNLITIRPGVTSNTLGNEIKQLTEEKDALQRRCNDLEKDLNKKTSDLNYYWNKSKDLEERKSELDAQLQQREKELQQARWNCQKQKQQNIHERNRFCHSQAQLQVKFDSEKSEIEAQMKYLRENEIVLNRKVTDHEETIERLSSVVNLFTSEEKKFSKEKDIRIGELETEVETMKKLINKLQVEINALQEEKSRSKQDKDRAIISGEKRTRRQKSSGDSRASPSTACIDQLAELRARWQQKRKRVLNSKRK